MNFSLQLLASNEHIVCLNTINKLVSIIYQEDPQRIISNKENSLTIMIIKSINIT
jgi:hypothetical protein